MKKRIFGIMLCGLIILWTVGCVNQKRDYEPENEQRIEKTLSCLVRELEGYIVTEKNQSIDIPQNEITNKAEKIDYYKASSNGEDDMYVIVKTDDYEVLRDFEFYFSNKYDIYQTFYNNDNIYVYFYNAFNDINLNDLKSCTKVTNDSNNLEENRLDDEIVSKIKTTNKIIIKTGEKNIGVIEERTSVNEIVDLIITSNQYGKAFLCDMNAFDFELYDNKDNLIDTIYVWNDVQRLIPASVHSGCRYYSVTNDDVDLREIIERETDYKFYTISDFSENCDSNEELIYEDENYGYYFNCIKSDKVLIRFDITGLKMTLKDALNNNYITPEQLSSYSGLLIRKK